jgi:cell shape-determining protein MreD
MRRYGYVLILVTIFAILQPTLLLSLGLSVYMPDAVAVIVATQAFSRNSKASGLIAIYAGLVVDLISPTIGIFGISSLSYLVVALVAGRYVVAPHDSALKPLIASSLAPMVVIFIKAIVMLMIFQPIAFNQFLNLLGLQLITGVVFAIFLVPVIDLTDRQLFRDSRPLRARA